MLKFLRRLAIIGLLAAAGYAVWKKVVGTGDVATFADVTADLGAPDPLIPATAAVPPATPVVPPAPSAAWVEPDDGACPVSHPVKGKVASGIFHVPGGQNYERTRADRCYVDAAGAEADGMRQAKR